MDWGDLYSKLLDQPTERIKNVELLRRDNARAPTHKQCHIGSNKAKNDHEIEQTIADYHNHCASGLEACLVGLLSKVC